jgi:nitroreductase
MPETLSALEVDQLKHAPAVDGVVPLFLERWSARSFADRDVSSEDLRRVFEAARWAASSSNEQPWRYVLGVRGTDTHDKLVATLAGFNQAWAPKAPVLILGLAKTTFEHKGRHNAYALYDLGAATAYLQLQAASMGLTTHQMGGYDHDVARESLGIPEEYALGSVMALGYRAEPAALGNHELEAREIAPRHRKPLSELVFSAWGEPAKLG